jgi:hypothetical protein
MHVKTAFLLIVLLSCVNAQEAKSVHKTIKFGGEVTSGEDFTKEFGNLLFRLRAEPNTRNPQGWTIQVRLKGKSSGMDPEFAWPATPPYRSSNPLYIDLSYGFTPEQAIAWTPRRFGFVTDSATYSKLTSVIDKLLWPAEEDKGKSQKELDKLDEERRSQWTRLVESSSKGKLDIVDYHLSSDGNAEIKWLRFNVELTVPCDYVVAAGLEVDSAACKSVTDRKGEE